MSSPTCTSSRTRVPLPLATAAMHLGNSRCSAFEEPYREGGFGVAGFDVDFGAADRREPFVDASAACDLVDGAAVDEVAGGEGAVVGVDAGVFRQRRMDVDEAVSPSLTKSTAWQHAHEAGEGDELDV